jgi:hypothetical protein
MMNLLIVLVAPTLVAIGLIIAVMTLRDALFNIYEGLR